MKLKFIGTNSLGFINGNVYDVKIETKKCLSHPREYIQVINKDNNEICFYTSLKNFLLDWEEQDN